MKLKMKTNPREKYYINSFERKLLNISFIGCRFTLQQNLILPSDVMNFFHKCFYLQNRLTEVKIHKFEVN